MKKKQKINPTKVKVIDGKVFREVDDIEEQEKIISVIEKTELFEKTIVPTWVYSKKEKLLQHKLIHPIIHSGEYTVSMALDVTKTGVETALRLLEEGLYSFDLLPHNFTYNNGKWILYDFCSYDLTPKKLKTQLRSTFKTSFASFELLKYLSRNEMQECFLNRIKHCYMSKILSPKNMFFWTFKLFLCLCLYKFKMYKKSYQLLNKFTDEYNKKIKRNVYKPIFSNEDRQISKRLDEIFTKYEIFDCFCVGENSAKSTLLSTHPSQKFVYLEDYALCDDFYNYLQKKQLNNISTAVAFPLTENNEIPQNLHYRAIYDDFTAQRFASDCAIVDIEELTNSKNFDIKLFCKHISLFSNNILILSTKSTFLKETIIKELQNYFNLIETANVEKTFLIIAKEKNKTHIPQCKKKYINENRSQECTEQSLKLVSLIQEKKSNTYERNYY